VRMVRSMKSDPAQELVSMHSQLICRVASALDYR